MTDATEPKRRNDELWLGRRGKDGIDWPTVGPMLRDALKPLAAIADAFDANELDDEARKYWGMDDEHINESPPGCIELYANRGGGQLLTLADCIAARTALDAAKEKL